MLVPTLVSMQSSSSDSASPLQTLLDLINTTLSLLLQSSLTVRSFPSRWHPLRSNLSSLQASLASLSSSPHWSHNPLLHTLLPSLLSTLQRLSALSRQCHVTVSAKLHTQSDLDMASTSLANHLRDLDLLLRSGVLHHSTAIVLSHPAAASDHDDLAFFVRDLFTRLQIGGLDFKTKAMESLMKLLHDHDKAAGVVAREGNVAYLIQLLDFHTQPCLREQAVAAVARLAAAGDEPRKAVFEEGGLGPLLRILESGTTLLKEQAAVAVEAITADAENAWAVSAYGGVSVLIESIRSGSPATQTHCVGAIRNVAEVEEIKTALGEEGAVPVLLQVLISGTITAQEKSANCLAILASTDEYFRGLIIQERGIQRMMHLIHELVSSETLAHVLRALILLSASSETCARVLSSSTVFLIQLGEFVNHGRSAILQQISVTLLSMLSISISDGNKRAIGSSMAPLVKLMESPKPAGLQESASQALVSLLTVRSNRKELVRDEKSVTRLMQMLDPRNEAVSHKFPVAVVSAILAGGSQGCRKRLISAGAQPHLQKLAEMEVAGAKKAWQRLSGNRLKTIFSLAWREGRNA